jgi:hypothetical protein
MRAYLRYSPKTFHDKVVVAGYPPGAFAAFCALLCLGEEQPERGRFRSERLLRLLLDEPEDGVKVGWGKWVKYLIDHGDLVRQDRGVLYIVGWDEWQEGDFTVAERVARLRKKRRDANAEVTEDVTAPVTDARLRQAVGGRPKAVGGRQSPPPTDDGEATEEADAIDAYYRLTVSFPAGKVLTWLEDLIRDFGNDAVSEALAIEVGISDDRRTLLSRTQDRLRAGDHQAAKEREARERAAAAAERQRAESMPEEQRAANLQRLGDMMRERGLMPSEPKA